MYSGEPADLEKFKNEKLQKILNQWKSKEGTYRHETKIEGRILYLFIVRTAMAKKLGEVGAEHDILVKERDEKIPDDQMKIRDKDGKVRKDIRKIKDDI